MDTKPGFPKFGDGDVCIAISGSKIYQLHSHVLRRLSPFFAQQLDLFPSPKLNATARRDGAAAYRFELNKYQPEEYGRFVRIRVNENGKVQHDNFNYPGLINDLSCDDNELRLWEWLFGSFYHIKPNFEDHNLATVLHSCMGLMDAADSIGSIDHVRGIVDHALLNQDQALWKSIAANPNAWTELGCRIQSQKIFREGVIHLIGLWQKMSIEAKDELRPEIRDLCELKHHELDFAKQAIDLRILGHYPCFIHRSHIDKPDRTSYSTDIYMWMAICFYRHYYAQAISENRTRAAEDGGFEFYNILAQGGNAYLHHEDFAAFHQYFPMSGKACNVLEANMTVLKEDVKEFVKDLVVVRTHLKPSDHAVNWLTCAVIDKKDYPWEAEQDTRAMTTESEAHQVTAYGGLDDGDIGTTPKTTVHHRRINPSLKRHTRNTHKKWHDDLDQQGGDANDREPSIDEASNNMNTSVDMGEGYQWHDQNES